jgi:hypothetical protein
MNGSRGEGRLPIVSPNMVDYGELERTGEDELKPPNVSAINVLDQQGVS